MSSYKQLYVFGELVEIVVSSEQTGNMLTVIQQTSRPGGGPPPHSHQFDDEVFTVIQGEYEFLNEGHWQNLRQGQTLFAPRGHVHTFRNSGSTTGIIQSVAISTTRFDKYLEAISVLEMPRDLERLVEVSKTYGIAFVFPAPPEICLSDE